jgi:hypothetical protein
MRRHEIAKLCLLVIISDDHVTRQSLSVTYNRSSDIVVFITSEKTPWPESASELYRLSDRRLSAKLVPTFADRGCHVVSATYPTSPLIPKYITQLAASNETLSETLLAAEAVKIISTLMKHIAPKQFSKKPANGFYLDQINSVRIFIYCF